MNETLGIADEKHKERKRICAPLHSVVFIETSYISFIDHFAAMQIDLCVRGWIGAFAVASRLFCPELCHFRLIRPAANCANLLYRKQNE